MSDSSDEDCGPNGSSSGNNVVLLSRAHALLSQLHAIAVNQNLSQRQYTRRSVAIIRQLAFYKDDTMPIPDYTLLHGPSNTRSSRVTLVIIPIKVAAEGGSANYLSKPWKSMLVSHVSYLGAYGRGFVMALHTKAMGGRRAIGLVEGIDGSAPTENSIVEIVPPENANKVNGGDLVNPPRTNANKTLADKGFIGNVFDLNAKYPFEAAV